MMLFSIKDVLLDTIKANKYSILFIYMIYYLIRHPSKAFLQYHKSKESCVLKMTSLHQKYQTIFITEFGILQSYLQLHRLVDPIERKSIRLKVPYNGDILLDVCNEDVYKSDIENDSNNDSENAASDINEDVYKSDIENALVGNVAVENNIEDILIDNDNIVNDDNNINDVSIGNDNIVNDVSIGNNTLEYNTANRNIKNVLLVHGFNGSSNSKYIVALCHHLKKAGYRIFCFNARGTKEVLNNSIFFHIGWTVDLRVAVEFILHNYKGTLEIYGFSMGGSWVSKYLGEEKNLSSRIIKGGAICLPFDFYKIEDWMSKEKWWYRRRFLNRMLAYNFCKYIRRNKETFKDAFDLDKIFKSRTLRDIDTLLTQKIFNFTCLNSYYKTESCINYLKNIKIPFLILNSKDDPIIPEFIIDKEECKKNPNILLVINPWGGHLGFLKNSLRHSLADEIILEFSQHFN